MSNLTQTEILKWHYKDIKYYAKSSNNVVTMHMGRRSPTGEGKFMFQTTVAKELFSMIHRNIKNIKIARDKKMKEDLAKQVEKIRETQRRKREEEGAGRHTVRPHSQSYVLDGNSSRRQAQTVQRQPTIEGFTSTSTIGTVADEDMIQLEGLADVPGIDEFQEFFDGYNTIPAERSRLSMGATLDNKLELDSLKPLTELVYQDPSTVDRPRETVAYDQPCKEESIGPVDEIYDEPPREDLGDSLTAGPGTNVTSNPFANVTSNPFANVTDPFASSPRGSFYNSNEDIFQGFDDITSPNKTSTPNNHWGNSLTERRGHVPKMASFDTIQSTSEPIYVNSSQPQQNSTNPFHVQEPTRVDVLRGLKDIQLNTNGTKSKPPVPKPRTLKRMTNTQMEEMWDDIVQDFKIT